MKKPQNLAGAGRREVPAEWRDAIHSHLDAGETVLAWLETDLDARLRFETGFSKSSKASLYIAVLLHRLQRRPRPRAIMPRRISRVPPRSE